MKKQKIFEALEEHIRTKADEKAGYPPNCNKVMLRKMGSVFQSRTQKEAIKRICLIMRMI